MKKLSLKQRSNLKGYIFIMPFIIGFLFFFVYPLAQSIIWSFSDVSVLGSVSSEWEGFSNYIYALRGDTQFFKLVYTSIGELLIKLPLILIFSFIMANFLKPKFAGRNVIRLIFFLPVVLSSGIVLSMEENSLMQDLTGLVTVSSLQEFLLDMNFPVFLAEYIADAVDQVGVIVNSSGIQILIFLAALQSISPSIYEAASIEGATAWESFWKITFPMVLPQIIVCMVYTVVNSFINANSKVISYVYEMAFDKLRFDVAAAMSVVYTIVIVIMLALFVGTTTFASRKYGS